MKDNKTVCAAFWKHTNVRSGNRVFACCRYKTPVQNFDGNIDNILHSTEYQKLRNDSVKGIHNPNCQKCYDEERLGKKSFRQQFNEEYDTKRIRLEYLEAGFDNICNLACDGCWEEWSSTWWIKKNPDGVPKEGIISTVEFFNIPSTINKLVFLGGEPLMTSRHRKFLEQLPDLSNLSVTYYTNGMFDLTEKDHNLFSQCKSVHFYVSIDAYGDLNNRVRQGSKWQKIDNFVKSLPYKKTINSVLHKNNWFGIDKLSKWIRANNLSWKVNILTYPYPLSINTLDTESINLLLEKLDKNNIPDKEHIKSYIKKNCQNSEL